MAMTSLKISKEEVKKKNASLSIASDGDGERYPYGTRLDLDKEALDKLGITDMPAVGTKMMLEAKVTVIGSRQSASDKSEHRSIELQITDMELGSDGDEVSEGELTRGNDKAMSAVAKKMQDM